MGPDRRLPIREESGSIRLMGQAPRYRHGATYVVLYLVEGDVPAIEVTGHLPPLHKVTCTIS